ncbi:MAG TPA: MarR family transcriptional regulator [Propionibacteriaceae bacterium]|nr:MarR family transcriptional regulator [Propionibacteriaceae bacterium]
MSPHPSNGPPDDPMVEARRLSALLIHVAERAKAEFAESVAGFDLPLHLVRAIMNLDAPAPMRELADHLACDRSYVTGLADQLEERGLVTRVPGEDRRVKLLELTAEGRELRDRLSDAVAARSMVLQRLTPGERDSLEPLLRKLLGADAGGVQPAQDC